MTMTLDKFGIQQLCDTRLGGLEWYCDEWNNGQSRILQEGDHDPYDSRFHYTCGQPNVGLKIDGT